MTTTSTPPTLLNPQFLYKHNSHNNIYLSGNLKSKISIHTSSQFHFSHIVPIHATLKGPKGFGSSPKKNNKTKNLKKNKSFKSLKKNKKQENDDEEEEEDEVEQEDRREQGIIPEIVTNRMIGRMAFSVGIPLGIGLLFFPFFYYLKVVLKIDVPTWVPFIVSFFFFGSALLGVSYGIVSASWDPLREGSFLGWTEAQKNWPVFWQSLRSDSGKD
ncbi:protein PAM68, chloroplastic [Trifolium pratense]|uniref:protein PAM68, chloroplastic n=1 Tax=Trifolium pratense TaxID=57577 RepID=UPI001E691DAE|nr:protein PAM68, chloroplastic [Trifolium pratense]